MYLSSSLIPLVLSLPLAPSQWNPGGAAFSRPARWLVALHGDAKVPFEAVGLIAGRHSRVLRNAAEPMVSIASAEQYRAALSEGSITLEVQKRKDDIWAAVQVG